MNHMTCWQVACACDGGFTDLDGSVRVALTLYRWTATPSYCSRNTGAEHEVVVGCVDNCIDVLLDKVSVDDHDSRRRHSSTSATLFSRSSRVALAIPFTPTDAMVIEAHATPHTNASCKPPG